MVMESDLKHAIATLRAAIMLNQIQEKKLRTIIACSQVTERRMQAQFDMNRLIELVRTDIAELERLETELP